MEERLYFTDDDLRKAVQEFAEKYFYDFPLIIHDIYFGKKSTSWLGQTVPLKGVPSKDIVVQNVFVLTNITINVILLVYIIWLLKIITKKCFHN